MEKSLGITQPIAQPFDRIARYYDAINDLLTAGRHRKWKRELVSHLVKDSFAGDVIDLATGTGDLALLFAKEKYCEQKKIFGIDPSPAMIEVAKGRKTLRSPIEWKLGGAECLPVASDSVGVLTCAFGVRNFRDRDKAFDEWTRVLKPNGLVGILEIHPLEERQSLVRWAWNQVMPRVAGWFADRSAYQYLRDTVNGFLSQDQLRLEVEKKGFKTVVCEKRGPGGMVGVTVFRKVFEND